jgi:hypothetical protein
MQMHCTLKENSLYNWLTVILGESTFQGKFHPSTIFWYLFHFYIVGINPKIFCMSAIKLKMYNSQKYRNTAAMKHFAPCASYKTEHHVMQIQVLGKLTVFLYFESYVQYLEFVIVDMQINLGLYQQ